MKPAIASTQHLTAKFRLQQFFVWSTNAVFLNFAIPFFEEQGITKSHIPYAITLALVCSVLGRFLWGYVIDRSRSIKKTYLFMIGASFLGTCATGFAHNEVWMYALMALFGLCLYPLGGICESWILRMFAGREGHYNYIRVFGSIGYTLFMVTYGQLVKRFGWVMIYYGAVLVFGILAAGALFIADIPSANQSHTSEDGSPPPPRPEMTRLFTSASFITACLVASLIFIANAPITVFMFKLLEAKGGDKTFFSIGMGLSALGEMPFFLLYHRIFSKTTHVFRLLIASCIFLLCFTSVYLAPNAIVALPFLSLYGMGYSIFLPTMRFYLVKIAPPGLETSAQTVADAFYGAAAPIFATMFFGAMINNPAIGMMKTLPLSILLQVSAIAIIFLWMLAEKRKLKKP